MNLLQGSGVELFTTEEDNKIQAHHARTKLKRVELKTLLVQNFLLRIHFGPSGANRGNLSTTAP